MLRKIIAGFVLALFVTLFAPFVFAVGVYEVFADRDFYSTDFVDFTYDHILDELPGYLDKSFDFDGSSEFARVVNRDFLEKLFTKDDYRGLIVAGISVLEESGFENGYYSVSIPISSILSDKLDTFPKGSREFLVLSSFPSDYEFSTTVPSSVSGKLFDFVNDILFNIFLLTLLALVLFLIIIGFLIFHPWEAVLRWEARAIFLGSLGAFLSSVLLLVLPSRLNLDSMSQVAPFIPIYSFFTEKIFFSLLYYLVPLLVVSLVLWTFAIYFDKKQ